MFLCPITRRGKKKKCKLSEKLQFLLRSSNLISFRDSWEFFFLPQTLPMYNMQERREKRKENNSTCCTFHRRMVKINLVQISIFWNELCEIFRWKLMKLLIFFSEQRQWKVAQQFQQQFDWHGKNHRIIVDWNFGWVSLSLIILCFLKINEFSYYSTSSCGNRKGTWTIARLKDDRIAWFHALCRRWARS